MINLIGFFGTIYTIVDEANYAFILPSDEYPHDGMSEASFLLLGERVEKDQVNWSVCVLSLAMSRFPCIGMKWNLAVLNRKE